MRAVSPGRRFAGILAWDSYFHLDHDHLRGAMLMFNTGDRHGEEIGSYRGDPLYHASLAPTEYETLLSQSGFGVVAHVVDDPRAGGRTVWLCKAR